jgi:hypothetical protein
MCQLILGAKASGSGNLCLRLVTLQNLLHVSNTHLFCTFVLQLVQIFDLFDRKRNGVIGYPDTPVAEKNRL